MTVEPQILLDRFHQLARKVLGVFEVKAGELPHAAEQSVRKAPAEQDLPVPLDDGDSPEDARSLAPRPPDRPFFDQAQGVGLTVVLNRAASAIR